MKRNLCGIEPIDFGVAPSALTAGGALSHPRPYGTGLLYADLSGLLVESQITKHSSPIAAKPRRYLKQHSRLTGCGSAGASPSQSLYANEVEIINRRVLQPRALNRELWKNDEETSI
jgi:hypothetical protein